jgi:hypothetical protein
MTDYHDGVVDLTLRNFHVQAVVILEVSIEGPLPLLPPDAPLAARLAPDRVIDEGFGSHL